MYKVQQGAAGGDRSLESQTQVCPPIPAKAQTNLRITLAFIKMNEVRIKRESVTLRTNNTGLRVACVGFHVSFYY